MQYVVLGLVGLALLVCIGSIFWEKWIGLELIQTYQSVFFILSMAKGIPFEFSSLTEKLKYSNGYGDFFTSSYDQIYTLPSNLIAISKEKEFLSNYNVNFIMVLITAIVLVILVAIKKRYQLIL